METDAARQLWVTPLVRDIDGVPISPQMAYAAWSSGLFPMAARANGRFGWYRPERRAVITPGSFRVPPGVRRSIRRAEVELRIDHEPMAVIEACAARDDTWICGDLLTLYGALFAVGVLHSVAALDPGGDVVGGLYGLVLGTVFSGESMFHHRSGASMACLVGVSEALFAGGFSHHDCQQVSPHTARLGAHEIDLAAFTSATRREPLPFPQSLQPLASVTGYA